MHRFHFVIIAGLTTILFVSGGVLIYVQSQTIKTYTKQLFGTKQDYIKLQTEYDRYKNQTKNTVVIAESVQSKSLAISDIINKYAKGVDGDISIYYKNLTTDESISIDPDKKYYMASLYKVILVLYLLDQIKQDNASFSDRVGTSSATLDVAIDKIITESNNEYAQTLATQYGWKKIEEAMRPKLGIDFSFDDDLQTSVKNMGRLFEEIAYSLNLSDWESQYLLLLMNNQKKTSKLPKYLPKNIYSHNKTGEFEGYSHDAGIFYTPRGNYILIFMSKSANPGVVDEQMAKMSKEIFDTLNSP